MRHVVCKAHKGFLENVALVYLQRIYTLQIFFPPWNSRSVLIRKHSFKMYFKTLLGWTPDPDVHFWKSSLFSDLKIKTQILLSQQFQDNFVTVVMGLYIFSQICGSLLQKFLEGVYFHICLPYWIWAYSNVFVEFCATWRISHSSHAWVYIRLHRSGLTLVSFLEVPQRV